MTKPTDPYGSVITISPMTSTGILSGALSSITWRRMGWDRYGQ